MEDLCVIVPCGIYIIYIPQHEWQGLLHRWTCLYALKVPKTEVISLFDSFELWFGQGRNKRCTCKEVKLKFTFPIASKVKDQMDHVYKSAMTKLHQSKCENMLRPAHCKHHETSLAQQMHQFLPRYRLPSGRWLTTLHWCPMRHG